MPRTRHCNYPKRITISPKTWGEEYVDSSLMRREPHHLVYVREDIYKDVNDKRIKAEKDAAFYKEAYKSLMRKAP